jgi:hypothetical protein
MAIITRTSPWKWWLNFAAMTLKNGQKLKNFLSNR